MAGLNWHLGPFVPGNETFWKTMYPLHCARQKIVMMGSPVITRLLEVLGESNHSSEIRFAASMDLGCFDDPRILRAYYDAVESGRINGIELMWALRSHLPGVGGTDLFDYEAGGSYKSVRTWLAEQVELGYDQIRLQLLDQIVRNDREDVWGLRGDDPAILRWLNRMYGEDFDRVLEREAPDALAFRNRELANGYDPVVLFRSLGEPGAAGADEQALRTIFVDPVERRACRNLIRALTADNWKKSPPPTARWKRDFVSWYWDNRAKFVFSFESHRFVARNTSP